MAGNDLCNLLKRGAGRGILVLLSQQQAIQIKGGGVLGIKLEGGLHRVGGVLQSVLFDEIADMRGGVGLGGDKSVALRGGKPLTADFHVAVSGALLPLGEIVIGLRDRVGIIGDFFQEILVAGNDLVEAAEFGGGSSQRGELLGGGVVGVAVAELKRLDEFCLRCGCRREG